MNFANFNTLVKDQIELCESVLLQKSEEYSTEEDKLHNFVVASQLQGITMRQALAGMMAKHTVSVYDLIYKEEKTPMLIWEEKITDHINYLLLLKAVLFDEGAKIGL